MADWLRPVFARTKTPILGSSTTPSTDRPTSLSEESNEADELTMSSRLRPASRVSSYIGLRPNTPPVSISEPFPNIRNPESLYHKPSGDQMAETLKVVMMTQGSMCPVPIEYNACILHVLEAYQDIRQQLITKQETIEELKQSNTKDIKEFEVLAMQWETKEKDYKAEVKRLEVLLSKTEGGMETVSMARSKSMVHGSKRASEAIGRGISTIKERHSARNHQDRELEQRRQATYASPQISNQTIPTYHHSDDMDVHKNCSSPMVRTEAAEKRSFTPFYSRILRSQALRNSLQASEVPTQEEQIQSPNPIGQSSILTRLQLETLEQPQTEKEPSVAFDSSTSGADSGSESFKDKTIGIDSCVGLGIGLHEGKPLSDVPISPMSKRLTPRHSMDDLLIPRCEARFESGSRESIPKQMSFSFQPGDDSNVLAHGEARDLQKRKLLEEHLRQRSVEQGSENSSQQSQRPKSVSNPESKPLSRKPHSFYKRVDDYNSLTRDDSLTSIVTAVRDNSGRSSVNSSRNGTSQNGRPKPDRQVGSGSGSSEAVTAAARAYTASQKGGSNQPRAGLDSRSGSRSQDGSGKGEAFQRKGDGDERESEQRGRATSCTNVAPSISTSEGVIKRQERQAVTD